MRQHRVTPSPGEWNGPFELTLFVADADRLSAFYTALGVDPFPSKNQDTHGITDGAPGIPPFQSIWQMTDQPPRFSQFRVPDIAAIAHRLDGVGVLDITAATSVDHPGPRRESGSF